MMTVILFDQLNADTVGSPSQIGGGGGGGQDPPMPPWWRHCADIGYAAGHVIFRQLFQI